MRQLPAWWSTTSTCGWRTFTPIDTGTGTGTATGTATAAVTDRPIPIALTGTKTKKRRYSKMAKTLAVAVLAVSLASACAGQAQEEPVVHAPDYAQASAPPPSIRSGGLINVSMVGNPGLSRRLRL